MYAYASGNPVSLIDPLGLIPPSPQMALAEAIASGNIEAIETLTEAGEISSAQAERAITQITLRNNSTGNIKQLADIFKRNQKAIEDAIHECKRNLPRSSSLKNPDVVRRQGHGRSVSAIAKWHVRGLNRQYPRVSVSEVS